MTLRRLFKRDNEPAQQSGDDKPKDQQQKQQDSGKPKDAGSDKLIDGDATSKPKDGDAGKPKGVDNDKAKDADPTKPKDGVEPAKGHDADPGQQKKGHDADPGKQQGDTPKDNGKDKMPDTPKEPAKAPEPQPPKEPAKQDDQPPADPKPPVSPSATSGKDKPGSQPPAEQPKSPSNPAPERTDAQQPGKSDQQDSGDNRTPPNPPPQGPSGVLPTRTPTAPQPGNRLPSSRGDESGGLGTGTLAAVIAIPLVSILMVILFVTRQRMRRARDKERWDMLTAMQTRRQHSHDNGNPMAQTTAQVANVPKYAVAQGMGQSSNPIVALIPSSVAPTFDPNSVQRGAASDGYPMHGMAPGQQAMHHPPRTPQPAQLMYPAATYGYSQQAYGQGEEWIDEQQQYAVDPQQMMMVDPNTGAYLSHSQPPPPPSTPAGDYGGMPSLPPLMPKMAGAAAAPTPAAGQGSGYGHGIGSSQAALYGARDQSDAPRGGRNDDDVASEIMFAGTAGRSGGAQGSIDRRQ